MATVLVLVSFGLSAPCGQAADRSEPPRAHTSPSDSDTTFDSYVAHVAAAQASFRLGEVADARRWLTAAPRKHRGWEWRHLVARLDESRERLETGGGPILALAVSPDGRTIAAGGTDGVVRLVRTSSGTEPAVLTGHTDAVHDVRFNAGGDRLATASRDGTVRVWDVETHQTVRVVDRHDFVGSWGGGGFARYVARGVERLPIEFTLLDKEPGNATKSIDVSPDETLFAVTSADQTVRVWSKATREWVATLRDHNGRVHSLAFSPDGKWLATAAADGVVRLWDVSDWGLRARMRGHRRAVHAVAWSLRGDRLYSGGADGSIRVWDSSYTGYGAAIHMKHSDACLATFFGPSGDRLFSCGANGWVNEWDADSGRRLAFWEAHPGASCDTIDLARDGRRFVSCSSDKTVRVWDLATSKELLRFDFEHGALDVAMSPDSRTVAIAHGDTITLRDLASRATVRRFVGHRAGVTDVAYSGDGTLLASASSDKTARVWHVATGLALATMRGHEGTVNTVAFDRTGSQLATGGADGRVKLWSSRSGVLIRELYTGDDPVRRLVFSPDGQRIAVASRQLVLVDVEHGVAVAKFRPHDDTVWNLQFSPDGRRLVSCWRDGTIVILDTRSLHARMGLPIPVENEDQ